MRILKSVVFFVLSLAMISSLSAQVGQTGSIRGHVVDAQKAPLPGATVTVTSPALMGSQSVISGVDGNYKFPPILPPGVYKVVAELQGFSTVTRESVSVRVGAIVEVSFDLQQEAINKEVTVVAPSPTVDVVSTSINQNATNQIIETLPFANRDVWTFAGRTAAGSRNNRPEIHGEGPAAFTFTIDGVQATASDRELGRHGDRRGSGVPDGRRGLLGLRRPLGLHERRHEVGRQRSPRDGPVLLHGQKPATGPPRGRTACGPRDFPADLRRL
jgi:hypothetical protein